MVTSYFNNNEVKDPRAASVRTTCGYSFTQQIKYVNCSALSMFKALNKGCK